MGRYCPDPVHAVCMYELSSSIVQIAAIWIFFQIFSTCRKKNKLLLQMQKAHFNASVSLSHVPIEVCWCDMESEEEEQTFIWQNCPEKLTVLLWEGTGCWIWYELLHFKLLSLSKTNHLQTSRAPSGDSAGL